MTRKDYVLIAAALRIPYNSFSKNPNDQRELSGVSCAVRAIADALGNENRRFNAEHFLAVVRGEKDVNSQPAKNGVR